MPLEELDINVRQSLKLLLELSHLHKAIDKIFFKIADPQNRIYANLGSFDAFIFDYYVENEKYHVYALIDKHKNLVLKRSSKIHPDVIIINPLIIKNPSLLMMPSVITLQNPGYKDIIKDIFIRIEADMIHIVFGFLQINQIKITHLLEETRKTSLPIKELKKWIPLEEVESST